MTTPGTGRSSKDNVAVVHLSVHPDVVFKLGADLITDDVQALVELVKNSYDADSTDVSIEVDSEVLTDPLTGEVLNGLPGGELGPNGPVRGLIRITDRGTGMTAETIRSGWLTVSASAKREMKRLGKVTDKGRTPLGDKGLGRLGAQRLGDIVEIATRPQGEKVENYVRIRWSDFSKVDSLDDVDLILETRPSSLPAGTTLTIRSLREPAHWHQTVTDLEQKLSAMVSPYGNRGFDVHLKVNGQARDLRERHEQVRRAAQIRYALSYADGVLTMHGRIATSYFRPGPGQKAEIPAYRQLVEHDNGAAFRSWILTSTAKRAAGVGLAAGDEQYFIEVSRTVAIADLDNIFRREGGPIDPGPFAGEVDYVPLRTDDHDVFNSGADYRNFVGDISGIRIYRDGFGVRVDKDWVGLGKRWSTGTSFYNLRPENVVGYIDLTARENDQLIETTNREGFQDTPAFRNFLRLMEAWRAFTEDSQGLVRRAWGEFRKARAAEAVSDRPMTPEAITQRAESRRSQLAKGAKAALAVHKSLQATQRELVDASAETLIEPPELSSAKQLLTRAVQDAQELSAGLSDLEREYQDAMKELDALSSQLTAVHEQLTDTWEAVSLGITAESLSHEIHQIADRLRARSQQTVRYLREKKIDDLQIHTYVEHVRSSAAALNRQVAHLDPALRFMRERRSKIRLSEVARAVADHYNDIWANQQIQVTVAVESDFIVEMNEGRLTQVLDNLLLNSGYWLLEQQRQNQAESGTVQIEVRSPYVIVTDTGPGVDPALEELIFEPFVTAKRNGRGRGLGLFVVRQLLDSEAATIDLDPSQDPDGRRRAFRLTFENAKRAK